MLLVCCETSGVSAPFRDNAVTDRSIPLVMEKELLPLGSAPEQEMLLLTKGKTLKKALAVACKTLAYVGTAFCVQAFKFIPWVVH